MIVRVPTFRAFHSPGRNLFPPLGGADSIPAGEFRDAHAHNLVLGT
jgi:hypothetical protein